jgi:glycine cleavage system aminomethyltransferase T/glycine/D-amino acid oxidase-like deaminating enzyme
MVLLDKGPLPDPGGSTGHASSFIMPVENSRHMTEIAQETVAQYEELGVYARSGGVEVARSDEHARELRRRQQLATSWGVESERLDPEDVGELVPYLDTNLIQGGFYVPSGGTCDPLRAGTIMRERAVEMGALSVFPNTQVADIRVDGGRVEAVETSRGTITADEVVIAAGVWSQKLARMAGERLSITPAVHQLISVGPIPFFEDYEGEISFPIVRDMDAQMYERQHGNDMEVGSYAHRPMFVDVDEIPPIEEASLSPTQFPFTESEFAEPMEHALELMPSLLDTEHAGVRHSIDGLLLETPDGNPMLGPFPDVDGLWSAAGVLIKHAPAIAENFAKWMTRGYPDVDLHGLDLNRFHDYGRSREFTRQRAHESFENIYGIVHPMEQWESARDLRHGPAHDRLEDLGARFFELDGWEYPRWFESNEPLLEEYADELDGLGRPDEWDARWWSPIVLAEHLAMRERVGLVDLSPFTIFDLVGEGAREFVQGVAVGQMDVDVGKAVYTPVLAENGGVRADLTIVRRGPDEFRVIGGGGVNKQWFARRAADASSVRLVDRTSSLTTIGVWGPSARSLVDGLAEEDLSADAHGFAEARPVTIGEVDAWALRLSFVGELGWELYAPTEMGDRLWELLAEAGREYDAVPVGWGVYAGTGRMEKGFLSHGRDLDLDYDPVEAGIDHHGLKDEPFVGRAAYAEALDGEPAATICTMTVEDHESSAGRRRFMLGSEPILTPGGEPIVDEEGRRSYVTSADTGPSVGEHILFGYLPPEYASTGRRLQVEYFGDRYPVTVRSVGNEPLFDPDHSRMRG